MAPAFNGSSCLPFHAWAGQDMPFLHYGNRTPVGSMQEPAEQGRLQRAGLATRRAVPFRPDRPERSATPCARAAPRGCCFPSGCSLSPTTQLDLPPSAFRVEIVSRAPFLLCADAQNPPRSHADFDPLRQWPDEVPLRASITTARVRGRDRIHANL
jgi:hypothetical protein